MSSESTHIIWNRRRARGLARRAGKRPPLGSYRLAGAAGHGRADGLGGPLRSGKAAVRFTGQRNGIKRQTGRGEGSSGLRFEFLVNQGQPAQ
jgi:hypothetical protein